MKQELSDMLQEAKSDPPPARYTVDDAVHAGRRLRRRHRAAWSAAVVVGVVVAMAMPQVLAGLHPAVVTPAAGVKPIVYPEAEFAANLAGFSSGDLTVSNTVQVTPGYQVAVIGGPEKVQVPAFPERKKPRLSESVGTVVVYRPGVFDPAKVRAGEPVDVGGRPGFYGESTGWNRLGLADPPPVISMPMIHLAWEYGDNAWAEVQTYPTAGISRQKLIEVATGVTSAAAQPASVSIKLTTGQEGFHLSAAGSSENGLMVPVGALSYLRLVKGELPYQGLAGPVIEPLIVGGNQVLRTIQVTVYPRGWNSYSLPPGQSGSKPFCVGKVFCYRLTDDRKYEIQARGNSVDDADLKRMLQGITVANVADRATWFDATESAG